MKNGLIVWTGQYETGIPILDEQHRGIVAMINSLFHYRRSRKGQFVAIPAQTALEEFIKIHFLTEELLLIKSRYPQYYIHKQQHRKCLYVLSRIGMDGKMTRDPDPLLHFLNEWWPHHLSLHDQRFVRYLRMGLKSAAVL